ncbi:TVP38/TMEM64 family protein [Paenibacillus nasutitermitis]|uniref:TVP38/TMEM64 family membrane protein n=1 Tax=Paenibacillus nasutitermitis TaxID=1652958 RepID=A0A916ZCX2_9BACL|nr:TVP38/TMEM64 family protein [Paenibacillus nasutitermitis]GGD86894.1 TVP38/TMEM64 family protein [Paenibacillus nasutitermitis]
MDISSWFTEDKLYELMDRYRSFGPLPGILLTFLKSFIPPLPTLVIVGINAAAYGLWLGFLYSWLGLVLGCTVTFLIVGRIARHPYMLRFSGKHKVKRSMEWVRRNAFSYVMLLSLFPLGPFVVINIAAALAGMRLRSFVTAIAIGKAIMVFAVSYIGYDLSRYTEHPVQILYVIVFIVVSILLSKRIEAWFARNSDKPDGQQG